jgi:hypothetical protein
VSGSNECLVDLYAHALNRRSQISRQTTARHPLLWAHALSPILLGALQEMRSRVCRPGGTVLLLEHGRSNRSPSPPGKIASQQSGSSSS